LLSPIGAYTWTLDAISAFTCGAVDSGNEPPVVSAIVKYNSSAFNRQIVNNAMDILGGKGIILGPKNLMGNGHMAIPIGITVEGSNVVTRSLITFGQGLIRSHPYVLEEMKALEEMDVDRFDKAFWSHMGMLVRNCCRATLLNLTRGHIGDSPGGPLADHYRKLNWAAANFAFMSDFILGTLGGGLRKKEKLSGRYADILSWLYISSCAIRKFEEEGEQEKDRIFADWILHHALSEIQKNFEEIYRNIPLPFFGSLFKYPLYWWARLNPLSSGPSDKLGHQIAEAMQYDRETREKLSEGIYIPKNKEEQLAVLEHAYELSQESADLFKKIRKAIKKEEIEKDRPKHLVEEAREAGVITEAEYYLLKEAEEWREKALAVDSYTLEELPVNMEAPQKTPADAKKPK
jgi:acyl-CoA dehydrogenase